MFPILVTMYVRLARREEREVLSEFGETYARYAAKEPRRFSRACAAWCGERRNDKARRRTGAVRMKTDMQRRSHWIFLGLLLLWGWHGAILAARAQATAEQPLELSSLMREALTRNSDIQAARQRWEAVKAFIPQVKPCPIPCSISAI